MTMTKAHTLPPPPPPPRRPVTGDKDLPGLAGLYDWLYHARPSYEVGTITLARSLIQKHVGRLPNMDEHGNIWLIRPYRRSEDWSPLPVFLAHTDTVTGFTAGLTHGLELQGNLLQLSEPFQNVGKMPSRKPWEPPSQYVPRPVLGADCGTGCWILCELYKAGIPGLYVWAANEEVGCRGTAEFVDTHEGKPGLADRLSSVYGSFGLAISFDRYGTESIVTHQVGTRYMSDDLAWTLSAELCAAGLMYDMEPDPGGVFTDSQLWGEMYMAAQATNISVGYDRHHTSREVQDIVFLANLRDALLGVDWRSVSLEALIDDSYEGPDAPQSDDEHPWARGWGWDDDTGSPTSLYGVS